MQFRNEDGIVSALGLIALVVLVAILLAICTNDADAHHNDDAPGTDGPNGRTEYVGTTHNDDLRGGNAPDLIRALGGNDRLGGEHGGDILIGGPGNDRIWAGRGKDDVLCGKGHDIVHTLKEHPSDNYSNCEVLR